MSEYADNDILDLSHQWTCGLPRELGEFIQALSVVERGIRPLIAEHVHYYEEILPSLLVGDIARWVSHIAQESDDPATRLRPLLARMEQAWGDGQSPVSDLIATSFVENVYDQPEVVRLLGPKLMHYWRAYTGCDHRCVSEKRFIREVVKRIARKSGWS